MNAWLAALEGLPVVEALRFSRWAYAGVNAAHILGIALLVGSILPMDLKLLGFWPGTDRVQLARVLVPTAACGLALAIATGALLFSVRAGEYAALTVLIVKLTLVAAGTLSALAAHIAVGWRFEQGAPHQLRKIALVSLICWVGALVCGRLIAFVA